jgi:fructose-1,6-bisphosphatase I
MTAQDTLAYFLEHCRPRDKQGAMLGDAIENIAGAAIKIAAVIANATAAQDLSAEGESNIHGDVQKRLDLIAHTAFAEAANESSVAWLLSEEETDVIPVTSRGTLALAIDPLDGSSNIAVNGSMGTIFSLLPVKSTGNDSFLQPGSAQAAAGYIVYGAQTQMALTLGHGTHLFALDPARGTFIKSGPAHIRGDIADFSINMSNYRHWPVAYRNFVDDCLKGAGGPLARDYNMRWLGAAVGEAHRILCRGGLYMYPADARKGNEQGRLRHVYECSPIALLMREAGGLATDGMAPILDLVPSGIHARCGLCFGSAGEMRRLHKYLATTTAEASPLFNKRGLFTVQD